MSGRDLMARVGRPILVAILVAGVSAALADCAARLLPQWHDAVIPLFCGLAALQAMLAAQLRRERYAEIIAGASGWALEIFSLAVCRQLWAPLFGGSSLLWRHFPVLDLGAMGLSVVGFLPIVAAWLVASRTAAAFELAGKDGRAPTGTMPAAADLGIWILGGGMLIAAADVLLRIPSSYGRLPAQHPSASVLLLIYIFAAVVLLSDVRFASLSGRWSRGRPAVAPGVPRSWLKHGGMLAAAALALALLLPLAGGAALSDIPFRNVFRLSGPVQAEHPAAIRPRPQSTQVPAGEVTWPGKQSGTESGDPTASGPAPIYTDHGITIPVGELLKGIGLVLPWLLLLASVAYRIRRRRDSSTNEVDVVGFLADLCRAAAELLASLPGILRRPHLPRLPHPPLSLPAQRAGPDREPSPRELRFRLPQWRTSRERVIRSYEAVARRAAHRGAPAPPGQVPGELAAAVAAMAPTAEADVHELAHRYLEARYSRREVGSAGANEAEAASKRVRALLR